MRIEPAGMNPRHFANAWTGHPIVADFAEHDVCLWHHEQDRIIRPILPLVMHTRQMQQILATGQGDWGVDEYTRECLALEVGGGRFSGDRVADVLTELFLIRGVPRGLRSDNGKEFVGRAVTGRLRAAGVDALAVEAGCPWENGVVESLNSILRDTLLNTEVFGTVRAGRNMATAWRLEYNHRRGHGALGYQTPAEYAARCPSALGSAALRPTPTGSEANDKTMVLS